MYTFRSEALTIVGGNPKTVPLNFLPSVGPRGGRLEIMRVIVKGVVTSTTDGSTSITAGGMAGWLTRLIVKDAKGDLWNVTGPEARAKHLSEKGRFAVADTTLQAVSTTATKTIYWVLDFAPKKAKRRWDFATPAGNVTMIELTGAVAGGVGTGVGLSAITQTYTVFVECREALRSVESKSRREVRSQAQSGTIDLRAGVFGGFLRDAFLFKAADHITGGTDLSSIGNVTIDALRMSQKPVDILQREFQQENEADPTSTVDPFVQASCRALPLWWPTFDGKIPDFNLFDGEVLVRLDANAVSNVSIVTDIITRRDDRSSLADANLAAAAGHGDTKVKTYGKTRTEKDAWGVYADAMPLKAVGGES